MSQFKKLGDYLNSNKPERFSFWSENQRNRRISDPCSFQLLFSNLAIADGMRKICLRGQGGLLCLSNIREISFDEKESVLGTVITVTCDRPGSRRTEVYKIIAS